MQNSHDRRSLVAVTKLHQTPERSWEKTTQEKKIEERIKSRLVAMAMSYANKSKN
jgi:hypothetical protein